MRAVLQRVSSATVSVDGKVVGAVSGPGLVVLLGVTHDDGRREVEWIARKIWDTRIFEGERSASEIDAGVLVVSQFTLYGDARKGRRPTWAAAAPGSGVRAPLRGGVRGAGAARCAGRARRLRRPDGGGAGQRRAGHAAARHRPLTAVVGVTQRWAGGCWGGVVHRLQRSIGASPRARVPSAALSGLSPGDEMKRPRVLRRSAFGALALTLALGAAGCSDEAAPSGSPVPSDSSSATPSASVPALPDAARGRSPEAAEAFVRHYVDLINYATADARPRHRWRS